MYNLSKGAHFTLSFRQLHGQLTKQLFSETYSEREFRLRSRPIDREGVQLFH